MTERQQRLAFAKPITALAVAFGRRAEEPLLEAYWWALSEFPLVDVTRACARAATECEHFPRPVELRRMLGVVSPDMRALKAWSAVLGAISSVGSYRSVNFDDPATNAAVRLTGGWGRLCRMPDRELEFARADFIRVYAMLCNAPPPPEQCRHLPGVAEMENRANGMTDFVELPTTIEVGLLSPTTAPLLAANTKPEG